MPVLAVRRRALAFAIGDESIADTDRTASREPGRPASKFDLDPKSAAALISRTLSWL